MEHIKKFKKDYSCLYASALMVSGKSQQYYNETVDFYNYSRSIEDNQPVVSISNLIDCLIYSKSFAEMTAEYPKAYAFELDVVTFQHLLYKGFDYLKIYSYNLPKLKGKGILSAMWISRQYKVIHGCHAVAYQSGRVYDPDITDVMTMKAWHKRRNETYNQLNTHNTLYKIYPMD